MVYCIPSQQVCHNRLQSDDLELHSHIPSEYFLEEPVFDDLDNM